MNRLKLKYRFLLLSFLLSLTFAVVSYISIYFFSQKHHLSFLMQLMLNQKTYGVQSVEGLQKLGLSDDELQVWLKSNVEENGFWVRQGESQRLYHIKKSGPEAFVIKIADVSLLSWLQKIQPWLVICFVILGMSLLAFSFLFLTQSLKPLEDLRRATEDILAGRHDMVFSYMHNDEVGLISQALKKLTQDLEKKDTILEKYTELAMTDGMTGLKNHRYFKENFQRELSLCKRHKDVCGLILVDVDHFKKFNDTYGHQQGDEVLKQVAQSLKLTARTTDLVARYGGEEFVLVIPRTDIEGLKIVAEKLRANLESTKIPHLAKSGESLSVTASFGVILILGDEVKNYEYTAFVEKADKNLYEAKKKGRNCVVVTEWKSET